MPFMSIRAQAEAAAGKKKKKKKKAAEEEDAPAASPKKRKARWEARLEWKDRQAQADSRGSLAQARVPALNMERLRLTLRI